MIETGIKLPPGPLPMGFPPEIPFTDTGAGTGAAAVLQDTIKQNAAKAVVG